MPTKSYFIAKFSLWTTTSWFATRLSGIRLNSIGSFTAWTCATWIAYCILITCWRTLGRRWFSPLNYLPGPKAESFLFQNASAIFDQPLGAQISNWVNSIPNDGLLHFFGLWGSEYVVATNVESLSDVLTNRSYQFQKTSGLRRYAVRFFGEGIVVQEGEKHKRNRKSFVQVFNQRQVDKLKPILSAKATQIVKHLSERCVSYDDKVVKSATINVNEFSKLISLDVMGIIALGIDFDSILGQNLEIFDVFQTLFSSNEHKKSHFMWHNSAPPWLVRMFPSKIDLQMEASYKKLRTNLEEMIPEKLASLKSTDLSEEDILTQIACSGDFTQEEIIPQIVTTLAAGFESTASTLSWTLYCLAANPEAQINLRKELQDKRSTRSALSEEDYEKLPLLNAVCSESSRLYPTFAMTLRKAICDTHISGHPIQAGTYIAIVPRAINRAKHLWGADADDFLPERWINRADPKAPKFNPTGGTSSPMCLLSFLYGPRSCVGRSLALAEIRRMTARIVECFHIETVDSIIPEPTGWLSSAPPPDLHLSFSPVQK